MDTKAFFQGQIFLPPIFGIFRSRCPLFLEFSDPVGSIFSGAAGHPHQKWGEVPPPPSRIQHNDIELPKYETSLPIEESRLTQLTLKITLPKSCAQIDSCQENFKTTYLPIFKEKNVEV